MITIAIRRSLALLVLLSPAAAVAQAPRSGTPAAPAATTRSGAANAAALPADYHLVVGDKLRIEVYKDPQLSQSVQIRPDGKITLPLVGDIAAAGQTSTLLRDAITGSLKEYVTNPVVTVIVVETQPQTFSVMGEVNNPGPQPLTGPVTVIEALAAAGGFKDFANPKRIVIQRRTPTGVQSIPFNYKEAVSSLAAPMYLRAGDIVIVP